jgi:hypothetical protein
MKRLHSQWKDIAERDLRPKIKPCPECENKDCTFKSIVFSDYGREDRAHLGSGRHGEWLLIVARHAGSFGSSMPKSSAW